ncbi:hypothetical protein [Burkholderia cenocepacia]|uniref:hypothetical protein n=1 Tax=Burkholderia cenocepacia TaxID=95486 RepID=UPI00163A7DE3|nr:hypothetical protein [Burkholderia cenocepacia]
MRLSGVVDQCFGAFSNLDVDQVDKNAGMRTHLPGFGDLPLKADTRDSGAESVTEQTALAVMPHRPPWASVVTTLTAADKCAFFSRKGLWARSCVA